VSDPRSQRDAANRPCNEPARVAATTLESETLFAGRTEVVIRHGDELYRLRRTRMNKLILTK
jgi:hemin uptake protein HemP